MSGPLYAVAGGKGGCGKTTTTLGLARAAAERVESPCSNPVSGAASAGGADDPAPAVLAVDADVDMPNLHRLAGVDRRPTLTGGPPDAVAQRWPDAPTVGVLAAPAGDDVPPPAFSRCRRAATVSFVDCPAGAGRDAATPLRAADAAVVVTTRSPACLRDSVRTAAMARALDTPVAGVVVSRADDPSDRIADLFDAPVAAAVPAARAPLSDPGVRAAHEAALATLGV